MSGDEISTETYPTKITHTLHVEQADPRPLNPLPPALAPQKGKIRL